MRQPLFPDEDWPTLLRWGELSDHVRADLTCKLEGLYGHTSDESGFDSLAIDKQQALLILCRRLRELKLWHVVRRVENVYGVGGVGMNFSAWPTILSTLRRRPDFTQRFANHRDTTGGFIERQGTSRRAALHVLYVEKENKARQWAAHFDLYNPWASPLNAWRHLLHEKLRGQTPDWRAISASLWDSAKDQPITYEL